MPSYLAITLGFAVGAALIVGALYFAMRPYLGDTKPKIRMAAPPREGTPDPILGGGDGLYP